MDATINDLKAQLDALQAWFAGLTYGFRENATPGQLQQFTDREREQDYLIGRLEDLEAEQKGEVLTSAELMAMGLL